MCPPDRIAVHAADTAAAGEAPSAALIDDLVAANHILFDQGVVDGFGHISARHDKRPDRFLLAATRSTRAGERCTWSGSSTASCSGRGPT